GFSVYLAIKNYLKKQDKDLKDKTYIVQGFGNVGQWLAHFMQQEGAQLIAVQDAHSSLYNPKGIDPEKLSQHTYKHGTTHDYAEADEIDRSDFFGLNCDIVVPAALGNQITEENAGEIKADIVAEGANGPV